MEFFFLNQNCFKINKERERGKKKTFNKIRWRDGHGVHYWRSQEKRVEKRRKYEYSRGAVKQICKKTRGGKRKIKLHQPGIEPGSVPWQGTILPLDHWCFLFVTFITKRKLFDENKREMLRLKFSTWSTHSCSSNICMGQLPVVTEGVVGSGNMAVPIFRGRTSIPQSLPAFHSFGPSLPGLHETSKKKSLLFCVPSEHNSVR